MSRGNQSQEILATAAQVAKATGGRVVAGDPQATCMGVSTDSRVPLKSSLFIALRGERFDGAQFYQEAVRTGSSVILLEQTAWDQQLGRTAGAAVVVVEDTQRALGDLAAWHRTRFQVRVVGITGSNGKTSTKEMAAAVLGGEPGVLSNPGNFNNQVGMPRSLLSLASRHHHVVMEMGMNAPGEIARLAEIAKPQVGVITNVHPVHLEGLGSIQAVARAKGELFESLPSEGTAVLNADDPYVLKLADRTRASRVTFGRGPSVNVRVIATWQTADLLRVELGLAGSSIQVPLNRPGMHNAMNAAAAAAVGLVEGVAADRIAEGLSRAPLPSMRMERLDLGKGHLLVDCYNANPRSVQAALGTLAEIAADRPRFAVLGDMRELGAASQELHRQTGRAAAGSGLGGLCTFGEAARDIASGAREAGLKEVMEAGSPDEATRWARERLDAGGWVLLKGSRAVRLERIARSLAGSFGLDWGQAGEE